MLFKTIKGIKEIFRKGNENWKLKKLFDQEKPIITVAQDGSGDFQKVEDALKLVKQINGGTITIKKGDYYPEVYSSELYLDIVSNLRIDGNGTANLYIPYPEANLNKTVFNLRDKKKIIIENLIFHIPNEWSDPFSSTISQVFKLGNSENIIIRDNIFKLYEEVGGYYPFDLLLDCNADYISGLKLIKNTIDLGIKGDNYWSNAGNFADCLFKDNNLGYKNWMDGYPNFDNCIVSGNYGLEGSWRAKYSNCKIKDNQATGDTTVLKSGSTLNIVHGNKFYGIRLEAGANYNNVNGNLVSNAVTDSGTGNTVTDNTIY